MGNPDVDAEDPASAYGNEANRRVPWRRLAGGFMVALGGIALSLGLSWLLREREQELTQAQFEIDAGERIEALARIVVARLATVGTTAAFFRGSDGKDRKGFSTFVNQILQGQPSIQVLAWAPHVSAARRQPHEQAVRKEGFSKYAIHERGKGGQLVAAGERDEYYPILLAEPLSRNQSLLGYDLASDAAFRAAFHEAAADRPTVVDYLPWNGNKEADRSLLYVVEPVRYESVSPAARPADQPELDGIVLGVFRVSALVERALDLFAPIGIDVYITRPSKKGQSTPIYTRLSPFHAGGDAAPPAGTPAASARENIHLSRDIEVANTPWTVQCVPTAYYLARHQTWEPLGTLLAGLFITGLLVGYFHLLAGRRARVERLVAECWRELR